MFLSSALEEVNMSECNSILGRFNLSTTGITSFWQFNESAPQKQKCCLLQILHELGINFPLY